MMRRLREINKQNKQYIKLLDDDTQLELLDLLRYMRASGINEYDCAQIESDLVAIVIDARRRGETIHDALGKDKKAFCRQLMESARPKTVIERIGYFWQVPMAILLFYTVFLLLPRLSAFGLVAPVTVGNLVSATSVIAILWMVQCLFPGTIYARVRHTALLYLGILVADAVLYRLIRQFDLLELEVFRVNCIAAVGVVALLWLLAWAARYWNARPTGDGGKTSPGSQK